MASRRTRGAAAREANLLILAEKENVPQQLSSPPATPALRKKQINSTKRAAPKERTPKSKKGALETAPTRPQSAGKKRKREAPVKPELDTELPHGLGKVKVAKTKNVTGAVKKEIGLAMDEHSTSKEVGRKEETQDSKETVPPAVEIVAAVKDSSITEKSLPKKARKAKVNPYGVELGVSPYPEWEHPTAEECEKVNEILSHAHGEISQPEKIPIPSLTVAGCGEVPCILEAMVRTLISAHTSNTNAGRAIRGAIKHFGTIRNGPAAGGVDWNKVRLAPEEELREAIKEGGNQNVKAKSIKKILDDVYSENQARRAELLAGNPSSTFNPPSTDKEADIMKAAAVALADENVLSLDYMHLFTPSEAFAQLITYKGIGVKTASCVLLFCMQHPSFAVDTHVWRLCKWLGWVPPKADRDQTFAHCDVRVPDALKYSLHQLLIAHGKQCGRCNAKSTPNTPAWENGCVIEGLVERTKRGPGNRVEKKVGGKKKKKTEKMMLKTAKKGRAKPKITADEGRSATRDGDDDGDDDDVSVESSASPYEE